MAIDLRTQATNNSQATISQDENIPIDISQITDEQAADFLESLIQAVTGLPIEEIPPEKLEEVAQKSHQLFTNYILNYIQENYGQGELVKLQAARKYGKTDIFAKFQNLQAHYFEAYQAFSQFLQTQVIR